MASASSGDDGSAIAAVRAAINGNAKTGTRMESEQRRAGRETNRTQRGGMTILRPSTTISLVMRLACLMEAMGTLYFELIPESVSPLTTVWMMAEPFAGASGTAGTSG